MQVNLLRLIAIIILVLPFDLIAAGPIKVQVQAVSVHLFFTPSGEFSEDILKLEGFSSWNFTPTVPIGKTSQQFHSYLIKMRFNAGRETFVSGTVASVEVFSKTRKRKLYASKVTNLYFPVGGEAAIARLVEGFVCEPVTVVVTAGKSRLVKNIDFQCGE